MSIISSHATPISGLSSGLVSRQSGHVALAKRISSEKSMLEGEKPRGNPFVVPDDQDIFLLRDQERQRKKNERDKQKTLKVFEKTTYASRVNAKTAAMRKAVLESDEEEADVEDTGNTAGMKGDPGWTMAVTRDRNVEKEDLAEYVDKKRQMFLVQYSLAVKREEMKKLDELAAAEERKLEKAERFLEEDAAMFDEFLKENDKNSVEAIKIAETETKHKLEKVSEIKKNTAIMMAIRSDISKHEETLKEYVLYKRFLDKLTPVEWKEEKRKLRDEKHKLRSKQAQTTKHIDKQRSIPSAQSLKRKDVESRGSARILSSRDSGNKRNVVRGSATSAGRKNLSTPKSATDSESVRSMDTGFSDDSDSEADLYFTDPVQLLTIFQDLEEQNLSLITNSQDTEEAIEELKQSIKQTKEKMERETDMLKSQINILSGTIRREVEKTDDLEKKCKLFSFGEFKEKDQDRMLKALHKKVDDVYKACIGDNEAQINTLQMLTSIENKLEELFEAMESMPQDLVEKAEKAKEKERRLRLREEKLAAQRAHQEERVRKALERAKADPKKKGGKPIVFRSEPPQRKQKENKKKDLKDKEAEELLYFFT